jgi:hypothetical protein
MPASRTRRKELVKSKISQHVGGAVYLKNRTPTTDNLSKAPTAGRLAPTVTASRFSRPAQTLSTRIAEQFGISGRTAMTVALACRRVACAAVIATSLFGLTAGAAESLYAPANCCEVERAGFPAEQSCWAKWNNPCAYTGYYVGGSQSDNCNQGRCCNSGTWGWDYLGRTYLRQVRLSFRHPPCYQGGTEGYAPDGPRPCEKVISQ